MTSELQAWYRCAVGIAVLLCLLAWLPTAPKAVAGQSKNSAPSSTSKPLPGQISGHVFRSDTGEPVPKAQVSLYPQDQNTSKAAGGSRIVRTGADGAFVFSDLPPGSYALEVWRNGFANYSCQKNQDCRLISLNPGQKLADLVLRVTPAGVIAGQVSDEDREPVAGIGIWALRVNFLPGGRRGIYGGSRTVSDDQGNFRMANMQPGSYYVRAGGSIERPMKQVALKQTPGGGLQYRDTYYPGAAGLDEARPVEVRPGAETSAIRFSVTTERTFTITGAVVKVGRSATLKPTEVHFTKRSEAELMFGIGGIALQADGSFKIPGLSPGEYTLTAATITNDGKEVDEGYASVRIVDSDVRANIELGRAGEVRGRVEAPAGVSLAGKQIILQTNGTGYHPSAIDSSGRFDVVNVPPGEYTVSMMEPCDTAALTYLKKALCSGKDYALQPLVLALGAVLNCELAVADDTGMVSGQVTAGDKPAAGLVVVLIPQSRELRRMPRYTLTGKTDAAGRYKIMGAIPGDYLLFAVSPREDHVYFALDFADRNQARAQPVSVDGRGTQVVNLRALGGQ